MSRWSTTIFLTCSTKMLVVFSNSFVHPRNTWTDLWLGMAQDVTIKSSSCQDSPDYFTCSYLLDGFLQEMVRNAWGQDHWIYRHKRCLLKVRQVIWSLSYFKIHDVILVNFRSDATSKTVPKYVQQPYGCGRSDRRTEELPSLSQVV